MNDRWVEVILANKSPAEIWADIFSLMQMKALTVDSPAKLHAETVEPDRLLAEAAWELWETFPEAAEKTSARLASWTTAAAAGGKAVLILDALSPRELFIIAEAAKNRNIDIACVSLTGSECPSTTGEFARSLGASSRASLADDKKDAGFIPFAGNCYTGVYSSPFEDCTVIPNPNLFIWHSWLDDHIHVNNDPDILEKIVAEELQGDGFWEFVNKLRKGHRLVITSDHGYAVSKNFSSEVQDPPAALFLRSKFRATRFLKDQDEWPIRTIPPLGMTVNTQRKWKVRIDRERPSIFNLARAIFWICFSSP
ncbi:MAG: hypothetical protein LBH85_04400 [Treponema sp.]|jgi:hypothetical protein|nr:hypothetical protein [Treponema sp.]